MRNNRFDQQLAAHGEPPLTARAIDTLQVNVGKLCNQACRHCHVDAGPHQSGPQVNMGGEVVDEVLRVVREAGIGRVDITGGAPELNPHFRRLVLGCRAAGAQVIDRCNLSVLFEPGQEELAAFLAENEVEVIASLPFYRKERTDRQRGAGVFDRSIEGLRRLNALGYGQSSGAGLGPGHRILNLVYNPVGAYLPGAQAGLEAEFRRELFERFGIRFDRLFAITNMPIARYKDWLERSGNYAGYMAVLESTFQAAAARAVMCRDLISVGPDGTLYDCDFNQMMELPVTGAVPRHIRDFDAARLRTRAVVTGEHCLGCTAGAGSSCSGSLTSG